ncbi:MAG: TolC family protein [Bryobacteraceae bacterium]
MGANRFAKLALLASLSPALWAQSPLSLKEAVRLALEKHPSVEAAGAAIRAAQSRITQARSGYLPKLTYAESWQRSDNPVFVFSSLLTQHQFTERNFAIGPLNRPDAINNFQSQVVLDQTLWDAGLTCKQVRSAELARQMAGEDQRRVRMNLIAGVIRAYQAAVVSQEALKVAEEAVRSAEADLKRAEAVRSAGMATDADVLAIQVHLAAMREQQIRRSYELQTARAALNEAMGLPLDTPHDLTTQLTAVRLEDIDAVKEEERARSSRPETRQVRLAASMAELAQQSARAALLPQVSFRLMFEADRQRFINRGGANWLAAASLRWNLFNGFADKARIEEAGQALARARAEQRQIESAVSLQLRQAYNEWKAAQERIQTAQAAVAQAEENLRIVRNRYESGLNTVTDLLRSETALLEARLRRLMAVHDQRLAAAALELAAGTLSPDSLVLN